jgi:double-strand break repair protein MRE11
LLTVRNFRFHDVSLTESTANEGSNLSDTDPKTVTDFLEHTVNEMAGDLEAEFDEKSSSLKGGTFKQVHNGVMYPPAEYYLEKLGPVVRQPLVRLRVEVSGSWEVPNPMRFGQSFLGRVPCAGEVLLYYRSKRRLKGRRSTMFDDGTMANGDGALEVLSHST